MISEIKDIKKIRKKIGLTQYDLAVKSGVSQSLITKIESGKLDPTFSKAKKIMDTLNKSSEHEEIKAEQIMQKKIISLAPDQDLIKAISCMKKYEISQLPILIDNKVIGYVSDSIILDSILKDKNMKVKDIMQDPPPIVSKNTSVSVITGILKFYPFILVSKKGIIKGIITKADVLNRI